MTAPTVPWSDSRARLTLILGPKTCPTCMEPLASRLHHELCRVTAKDADHA